MNLITMYTMVPCNQVHNAYLKSKQTKHIHLISKNNHWTIYTVYEQRNEKIDY